MSASWVTLLLLRSPLVSLRMQFHQELEHHIKVIQVTLCDPEEAASLPSLGAVPELVCLPVKTCGRKECRCSQGSRAWALETEVSGSPVLQRALAEAASAGGRIPRSERSWDSSGHFPPSPIVREGHNKDLVAAK